MHRKVLRIIAVSLPILATGAIALFMYKQKNAEDFFIPCVFHYATGLYCPGCGSGRALYSLMHLRFYAALRYNAFAAILLPALGILYLCWAVGYVRTGGDQVMRRIPQWIPWVILAALVLYGILRNLGFPFSLLAPTAF